MNKKLAVIDLGTNTCNLLIAEYTNKSHQILYQGKEVVKLGKGGINKDLLTNDGLVRATLAIKKHQDRIKHLGVNEVVIIATSAVREAINKDWFTQQIKESTGLDLHIISGEKEAELIFKGVKLAFGKIENHSMILDIGGGSNEFILTEHGEPIWKQSFPLGMARVIELIPPSDPITPEEINEINTWFDMRLESLWARMGNVEIPQLIGCSGAFDTIADLIDETDPGTKIRVSQQIALSDFNRIYRQLVNSTTAERTQMKGMESIRIEMIVPSVLFIKLVVDRLNIKTIFQTDYALREGVLYERIFS
jgi:exopolyphosphatase/guanosine-5'-triphosphate,3'-diphosphate pyrophosphatase